MKVYSQLLLVFSILLTGTACQQARQQKTLFLAHGLPVNHPVHKGMIDFQQRVARKSGGTLEIKIFPDGQLGSERELLELLQIGSVAMTKVSAAAMANFAPEYQVLGVPYLFRDREHLFKVLEGEVGRRLLEKGSDYWLRGLCFYDAGSRSFYTKTKPVRTPEDLAGMKIRVMNHQMSVDMVNTLGGSATPMAYGELYTALQQGVVDGAENNLPSFVSSNHFEVCKYYTLDEHSSIPDVLVIGTKFWGGMIPREQQWLSEAAAESVAVQKKYWDESVAECMAVLRAADVEIIQPEKSLFSLKVQPVLDEFAKDPKMQQLVKTILAQ